MSWKKWRPEHKYYFQGDFCKYFCNCQSQGDCIVTEADSDDSGTDIAYSESDYEQRDSDLEFAAEYCV